MREDGLVLSEIGDWAHVRTETQRRREGMSTWRAERVARLSHRAVSATRLAKETRAADRPTSHHCTEARSGAPPAQPSGRGGGKSNAVGSGGAAPRHRSIAALRPMYRSLGPGEPLNGRSQPPRHSCRAWRIMPGPHGSEYSAISGSLSMRRSKGAQLHKQRTDGWN